MRRGVREFGGSGRLVVFCFSLFLCDGTYAHAQEFAASFLYSTVGRKAFQYAELWLTDGADRNDVAIESCADVIEFLTNSLRYESNMVNVLRIERDTYRAAFAFIVRNCGTLKYQMLFMADHLFHSIISAGTAKYGGMYNAGSCVPELVEGLQQYILCGGLSAFSAAFWAVGSQVTFNVPADLSLSYNLCFAVLLDGLANVERFDVLQKQIVTDWCATEATSKQGMLAGFYSLFRAAQEVPRQLLRAQHIGFCRLACEFLELLRGTVSTKVLAQAVMFPYQGKFPLEETWLFHCLFADRRMGAAVELDRYLPRLWECVQGIEWAVRIVDAFVAGSNQRQLDRDLDFCALPGCSGTSTAVCALRKCGRCRTAHYCSPRHQHMHWPTHKAECVKAAPRGDALPTAEAQEPAAEPEYVCALPGCEAAGTALRPLDRCSRCRAVRYCCQAHQREHWPVHKHQCANPGRGGTPTDAPPTLPASAELCAFPGCQVASTALRPLDRCGRCRAVSYCGSTHQRAHWPTHKSDCGKATPSAGAAAPLSV
jgi:hypothetical protein